eukprot:scaffold1012_cov418-Prasinococcus_capsulatus_cf.AAC.8
MSQAKEALRELTEQMPQPYAHAAAQAGTLHTVWWALRDLVTHGAATENDGILKRPPQLPVAQASAVYSVPC